MGICFLALIAVFLFNGFVDLVYVGFRFLTILAVFGFIMICSTWDFVSLPYCVMLWTVRLPVPVISVGNLTWGGNGKTPMVEFLAVWLAAMGSSPLILTRVLCYFPHSF